MSGDRRRSLGARKARVALDALRGDRGLRSPHRGRLWPLIRGRTSLSDGAHPTTLELADPDRPPALGGADHGTEHELEDGLLAEGVGNDREEAQLWRTDPRPWYSPRRVGCSQPPRLRERRHRTPGHATSPRAAEPAQSTGLYSKRPTGLRSIRICSGVPSGLANSANSLPICGIGSQTLHHHYKVLA